MNFKELRFQIRYTYTHIYKTVTYNSIYVLERKNNYLPHFHQFTEPLLKLNCS